MDHVSSEFQSWVLNAYISIYVKPDLDPVSTI